MCVHNLPLSSTAHFRWRGKVGRREEDRFARQEEKETVNRCETIVWRKEAHGGGDWESATVQTLGRLGQEEEFSVLSYVHNALLESTEPPFQESVRNICIILWGFWKSLHPPFCYWWWWGVLVSVGRSRLQDGCVPGCLRNTGTATLFECLCMSHQPPLGRVS